MKDQEILKHLLNMLDDKKAEDIVAYKIGDQSSLAEYIVIASGTGETHVNAMSEFLKEEMKKLGEPVVALDGYRISKWVCMDFSGVIVHLMSPSERDYYDLESIWGACPEVDVSEYLENRPPEYN